MRLLMKPKSKFGLGLFLVTLSLGFSNCSKSSKDKLTALTQMSFSGKVMKAGTTEGIAEATVRAIKLLDQEALQQLVEAVKVPDGNGGTKDKLRVNLDKVHNFAADVETKTDANGGFQFDAPLQAYLVYTFGPGATPGAPGSYSVDFWGIAPETGELSLDHLIGKDGKTSQTKNEIYLAGGPTPPPVPAPPAPPVPSAVSEESPPELPPSEPTVVDEKKPENIIPPEPDLTFWKTDVSIVHSEGSLDKEALSVENMALPDQQRYFEVRAELSVAQTEPIKLVMQVGFDSSELPDCPDILTAAKTVVYDVMPNGTEVLYKLVPPSPFYKLYFAKNARKELDKPVTSDQATSTLTVGKRDCGRARPERPFVATLSWDKDKVDIDLHISSAPWAEIAANGDKAQMADQASWTSPNGKTLTLDVDNTYGYGPENIGESPTVADVNSNCYVVQAHAYSGASFPVKGRIDIVHVSQKDGIYNINKYTMEHEFTKVGEWWPVGIFPPNCKEESPPSAPVVRDTATAAGSACGTYPSGFDDLDIASESLLKATGTFDGQAVTLDCKYGNANRVVAGKSYQNFDYMPSMPSGDSPVSVTANCSMEVGTKRLNANLWLMRVNGNTSALEGNTTTTAYPYFQLTVSYNDRSKIFRTPNAYGSAKGTTFLGGNGTIDILEKQEKQHKAKRAKGCFSTNWTEEGAGNGNLSGFFDLNFTK